ADAGYESGSKNVYLPSRQNWSYVLYIQSVYVQLLKTTGTYCVLAFTDLSQLLVFGWFVPTVIVFMGIIARIWLLCQTLTEKVVSSYNKIYLCREMFEPSASGWSEPLLAPLLCSTTKVQPKLVE
uniref:Nucleolus and neural progenitor protein-like N-terminal domain-containing protein n=1 Tax=Biomphalaria glabrata TaxID=6526 RepID=A0A2C9LCH2_BIOGL